MTDPSGGGYVIANTAVNTLLFALCQWIMVSADPIPIIPWLRPKISRPSPAI